MPLTLKRDSIDQDSEFRLGRVEGSGLCWGYIGIMEKNMETTLMGVYRV